MKSVIILLFFPLAVLGQENARVLSYLTTYTIRSEEDAEIEETYRIQINSDKGRQFAMFQDYFDQFRKISDVTVDIYDMQGKRIKRLRRSDGVEIGFNPSYEINDAKLLLIRPEYQNYPFIVEVQAVVKLNGYLSLPPWVPRGYFNLAVDQSKLVVSRPENLNPAFKEEFIKGTQINEKGNLVTTYEVTGLPAVDRKARFRDFYESEAKVLISPRQFKLDNTTGSFESWSAFGDWFLSLNSEPCQLDPKTTSLIQSMNTSDKREVIRRLYEYMQDKTRYVSIQLGIGGFKSLPTEDVEKYGYGDCKALSTYMKNMLDNAGIKSHYILVHAGNDVPDVKAEFPSNQFNHVYIGVPMSTDTVYLECTSQISPSNYTGTFTDDRNVLWIDKNRSRIIRSRIYPHTLNVRKSKVSIDLSDTGDATISQSVTNEGVFFDEIMLFKNAPASYIEQHNQSKFGYSDFAIKDFKYTQPDRHVPSFSSTYNIQVKGLAKAAGTRLVFPAVPTTPTKKYIDGDDLMRYYTIKRGMTVEDEIIVNVPRNLWIYSLPEKESVNSRFGSYSLETEFDDGVLKIKRSIVLYKGDYQQKEYEEFKAFLQQMERLESRKLVMNSKT